jgi:hypothetical protein
LSVALAFAYPAFIADRRVTAFVAVTFADFEHLYFGSSFADHHLAPLHHHQLRTKD